jgi:PilZ domain
MIERRAIPRQRIFKSGTIAFNRAGGITATVKNLTRSGAMLEVESVLGIPDEFTLVLAADHSKWPCKVVWRQAKRLGVCFV